MITVPKRLAEQPNLVIENVVLEQVDAAVRVPGADVILSGSVSRISSWASGYIVHPGKEVGRHTAGPLPLTIKKIPAPMDDANNYYYRSKPQYESVKAADIVVATLSSVRNDATGDQTAAINLLLSGNVGRLIFFPGGTYMIQGTINVPVGSKIVGSGWSSFMATGGYFENEKAPKPLVRVGKKDDKGVVEISNMLFTTKVRTPGCVHMEWNVHESTKASAAMWDSRFRIGGGAGTELRLKDCPAYATSVQPKCMAASLMMHVTNTSGLFDNVWAWVADHDLEDKLNDDAYNGENGIPTNFKVEISIYVGRGVLIESLGPTWFCGSASEHAQLYEWQLHKAEAVFLGNAQTETPYYQANPTALGPYEIGLWPEDPTFETCGDENNDAESINGSMAEANEGWVPRNGDMDEDEDVTIPAVESNKCSKAPSHALIL
jgi:glucan 1,3-beta-glucosidase